MRQIVLDTETTGIDPKSGHRLIEIGCVELVDRKLTGNTYHQYINPERDIEQEAIDVHGITPEFLADKPVFTQVAKEFIDFVSGAELIIHNAPFDIGFLDNELMLDGNRYGLMDSHCTVIDTLVMARAKHPGQRNNLDVLCRRYGVDNSHRDLHGALLDSEILADVYLLMTGGQRGLELGGESSDDGTANNETIQQVQVIDLPVLKANESEVSQHNSYLDFINKKSDGQSLWHASDKDC